MPLPPALVSTDLPGADAKRSGKVRDVYEYGDRLLIVATDRLSTFDVVLPTGIPGKGKILTALSLYWFDKTRHLAPNHLITTDLSEYPFDTTLYEEQLEGRSMLCRRATVLPVECVVRGYLAGSAWKAYQKDGEYCGIKLPPGLVESAKLPEPVFTPTTKAAHGHDVPITMERMAYFVGGTRAELMRELSLTIYGFAAAHVEERGFILCDTKFEFGMIGDELMLVDEILTPDASRYWDKEKYEPGRSQEAFDKQYVRDYLEATGWDKEPPAPALPDEVVKRTIEIYRAAEERITGSTSV